MKRNVETTAMMLAYEAHKHQKYADGPYHLHLASVVEVLRSHGVVAPIILAAAWLHDIIEDQPYQYHDVVNAFQKEGHSRQTGIEVADIVYDLTDELGKSRKERKAKTLPKLNNKLEAQIVKLADWIANVSQSKLGTEPDPKLGMYKKEYPSVKEALYGQFPYDETKPLVVILHKLYETLEFELAA